MMLDIADKLDREIEDVTATATATATVLRGTDGRALTPREGIFRRLGGSP